MGNESKLNTRLKLLAVAVSLACSGFAGAAALGNLSVLSGRGQPLQAEIELALAHAAEADGLVVKVFSPEEYWNPGAILPEGSLRNVSARTEKRSDGSYVVKVASAASVDTQQLALLAEVSSSEGKSVREYIVHLPNPDPATATDIQSKPLAAADAPVLVKPGDNLSKIARANKPAEVSMEQMLVALYHSNPQAFSGKNMNRLKAGKVLRMPTSDDLAKVTQPAARREIHVHVADWNAYRQKVSGNLAVPANEESSQASSGKIESGVSAREAADRVPHQEVLKLSKGDAPGADKSAAEVKSLKDKLHAMEEDLIARDQALQESKDRIAMLEKNNREMQRLLELKSAAAEAAPKVEEPAQSAPETASSVEAAAPVAAPVSAVVADPKAEAEAPAPKPGSKLPMLLWGGAVALLVGLGSFLFMRRNRKAKAPAKKPVQAAAEAPGSPFPDTSELLVNSAIAEEGAEAMVDVTNEPLSEAPAAAVPLDPTFDATEVEETPVQLSAAALAAEAAEEQAAQAAADLESGFAVMDEQRGYTEPFVEPAADLPVFEAPVDEEVAAAVVEEPRAPAASEMELDIPSFVGKTADAAVTGSEAEPEIILGEEEVIPEPAVAESFESAPPVMASTPVESVAEVLDEDAATLPPLAVAQPTEPVAETGSASMDKSVAESAPEPVTQVAPTAAPAKPVAEEPPLELDIPTIADFTPPDTTSLPPMPGMEGVDLNLIDDTNLTEEELQAKGEQWLQVATKLDLARAYQEMGDDAGAREILDEVVVEGDAEQKAMAEQLLQMLPPA